MAVAVYERGGPGRSWRSTLDAAWMNVTLVAGRVQEKRGLALAAVPEPLTVTDSAVITAADPLAIPIVRRLRARSPRR